jgi:peptidoglycan hydrolase-like protein with peptidoglycan-binding domain
MKALYLLLAAAIAAAGTTSAFAAGTLYVDSKTVQKAQKTLNDRGYRTGGVDGKMGPQTQAAIVNFQRAEKLQPTGKLDKPTLMRLGLQKSDGTARASNRYGSGTIRKVQATLNARGYKAGAVNGVLDQSTQSALRAFQKSEGLKITGRPNPRTLAHLGITEQSASAGSSSRR